MLTGDSGIITQAQRSKMMTELSGYKEELEIYIVGKLGKINDFNETSLVAGKNSLAYDGQQVGEIGTGTIKDVIPSISDKYLEKLEVIKGELLINTKDKVEIEVAQSLGIQVNPYDIVDGELLSSTGNLLLLDETETLTIPSSVTKIGSGAFANSASDGQALKKIIIPGYVKEIAPDAFSYNTTLEEVVMEYGIEKVGDRAFQGCTALKEISFPDSVTSIGSSCLRNCSNLIEMRLSNSITTIPVQFCLENWNLTNIEIPEGVIKIEQQAFYGCKKITSITLPSTLQTISGSALGNMTNLTQINIPSSNEYIKFNDGLLLSKDGTKLYYALSSLQTVTIPDGVTTTVGELFNGSKATTIKIPNTLTGIAGGTFNGMNYLTTIEINEDNPNYKLVDGNLYSKNGETLIKYIVTNETEITIPEGVKRLTTRCIVSSKVKQLNLPTTLETIDGWALNSVTGLTLIELPQNVKTLSTTSLPGNAKLRVVEENANLKSVNDTMILSKDGKTLYATSGAVGEFEIPETVETIYSYAFYQNKKIQQIEIPEGVKSIKDQAFRFCSNLNKIIIPNTVTSIASNAFVNCSNLKEIRIDQVSGSISGSPWSCPYGARAIYWK